MANYSPTTQPTKNDEYYTPKYAWTDIAEFIPKNKVIWESFYCADSKSAQYLKEMGHEVIFKNIDFFNSNEGEIIVSNPPFTKKKEVLERLTLIDKPFIIIVPLATIVTKYFKEMFGDDDDIEFIFRNKRIQFEQMKEGLLVKTNKCSFDCIYICYKINIGKKITWI
jgi:hypothetical protein